MLTWKIAWRNVLRHKGKTFVVGLILFIGMLIMTVGNAIMSGTKQELEANIQDRVAGDVMLVHDKYTRLDAFMSFDTFKLMRNYPAIKAVLAQQDFLEAVVPMTRGAVAILNETGVSGSAFFFGVKFDDYQAFSQQNVVALEGTLLTNTTRGVLLSDETRQDIFDRQKFWVIPAGATLDPDTLTPEARKLYDLGRLQVRTDLVLAGQSEDSLETDIRAPVRGIFQFREMNKWWAQVVNFMDLESYRQCFGDLTAGDRIHEISDDKKAALTLDDDDAIFDAALTTTVAIDETPLTAAMLQQQTARAEVAANVDLEDGGFTFVFLKVKPGVAIEAAAAQLNQALQAAGLPVRALTWELGMGEMPMVISIMQGLLFLFVLFLFFVATIIIMNTLSMAALERSSEIGMMRAIGAQKSFINAMFLLETFQVACVSGGLGIVAGLVIAGVLNLLNIPATANEYMNVLMGGDTIRTAVSLLGIFLGVLQLLFVTVAATIYPIRVAGAITPLQAIARD